ncbi:Alpha-1-2-mannosyltransferase ALG9-like [Homarus americanus]|uniref:Mannosyltransferase n=1 Tax=Homarus americanus TaxID=6706 RepID=A0A8J5JSH7_HOMAM|nr:Alpha-1-2-mannosyltransferase ALG9-like [Homarus americanus]
MMFFKWCVISAVTVPMVQIDSQYFGRLVIAPLNIVGVMAYVVQLPRKNTATYLPFWLSLSPLYLWLTIFMLQPHKEERFLFPVYPLVCLAGTITIAYHAPLETFMELNRLAAEEGFPSDRPINVCMGKEWHRFPSSFFLPGLNWNLHFIESEFRGQLPKPYSQEANGTNIIPDNMNDSNEEERSRYIAQTAAGFLRSLHDGATLYLHQLHLDAVHKMETQESISWAIIVIFRANIENTFKTNG